MVIVGLVPVALPLIVSLQFAGVASRWVVVHSPTGETGTGGSRHIFFLVIVFGSWVVPPLIFFHTWSNRVACSVIGCSDDIRLLRQCSA